jgi:hypothetical protein
MGTGQCSKDSVLLLQQSRLFLALTEAATDQFTHECTWSGRFLPGWEKRMAQPKDWEGLRGIGSEP